MFPDVRSGKSVFLLLLLMRRLAYGLPTVLQVDPDSVILFHDQGVSQLTSTSTSIPYGPLFSPPADRILALVDTNPVSLPQPAIILMHRSPFFVVNTISPCSDRREWFTRVNHDMFYMNPWSVPELLQA